MKHLVFCWEYGAGYGHIAGFLPIAKLLEQSGVKVSWVVKHLDHVHLIKQNSKHDVIVLQAPVAKNSNSQRKSTFSYAHMLSFLGFSDKQTCLNLVSSWRDLLTLLRPDMVLVDHAPAALIAAKTLELKSGMIGTGFFSPPRVPISPAFCVFNNLPVAQLNEPETHVVSVVNHSLSHFGCAGINHTADIFSVEEDFLCTFPELDHFPERKNAEYWGACFTTKMGSKYNFKSDKFRIFVYVGANTKGIDLLLFTLNELAAEVILHIPKSNVGQLSKQYSNLSFSSTPIEIESILAQCDLVICNSGHGTVAATLIAGVRLLLLPNQLEQRMLALRLKQQSLAAVLMPEEIKEHLQPTVHALLGDKIIKQNVQNFRARYWGFDNTEQTKVIASRCLEIMNSNNE